LRKQWSDKVRNGGIIRGKNGALLKSTMGSTMHVGNFKTMHNRLKPIMLKLKAYTYYTQNQSCPMSP